MMKKAMLTIAATACLATPPPAAAQAARSISAGDKAQGAKADPDLRAQFGGAYDGPQAAFVDRVGKRVAVQSGLSNARGDFTVTLLNSPVENAFAIPGGYVYVTRQLLALMNSEAELAAVLGHEVGHVAARHSTKRNTRSTIGSILSTAVGVVTGSDLLTRIAGTGSQLLTLGYSRSQEYEADKLGVRYSAAAGYTPYAMSSVLAELNAEQALEARISGSADATPSWMSTHPNGTDRVARAWQLAQAAGPAPASGAQDTAFLRMLDGLGYDDDPAQGVIDGQTFRAPGQRLRFTAPAGYTIANATDVVSVRGRGGTAQLRAAAATRDLPGFIAARLGEMGAARDAGGETVTGRAGGGIGYAMRTVPAAVQQQAADVTLVAYDFPSATYWFTLVTPRGSGAGPFAPLVQSVALMTASEAASIKGKHIRIVTVGRSDTIASLSTRMAYGTFQRERFMTLNGLADDVALVPGMLVKIVVAG